MSAKPEPFWIERIAAGHPPRLRNPGESVEDYRVAMGWDQPKAGAVLPARPGLETLQNVIECLRETGRYVDEEGEATDTLADLIDSLDPGVPKVDPMEAHQANGLAWAVSRWKAEVSLRPLVNVHRRTLDDAWRQAVRYFGGDPDKLLGPNHDALLAAGKDGVGLARQPKEKNNG